MATLNAAGTTSQKGAAEQYGRPAGDSKVAYDSTKIHPFDSGTVLGTVPPGKAGIKQISGVVQNATDPLVDGQLDTNQADNFLAVTSGSGVVPTMNAAQAASAGKSLAPEHE